MATKKERELDSTDQATEQVVDQEATPVAYKTAGKHSAMFDVLVGGKSIQGQWGDNRECIMFSVPAHLADGFEKHWHFTSGNVIKAD
jgi:hypothetical protein